MAAIKYIVSGIIICSYLLNPLLVNSQDIQKARIVDPVVHHEVPDDDYISNSELNLKKGPAYKDLPCTHIFYKFNSFYYII